MFILFKSYAYDKYFDLPDSYAEYLKTKHEVEINLKECQKMEERVGQLLYLMISGANTEDTIDPLYDRLVKRIQPGGVLPKYNTKDINKIRKANQILQEKSKYPLLIGIDKQWISINEGNLIPIGLGTYDGIVGGLGMRSPECYKKIAQIEGALHAYAGINNPLGPTIEKSPGRYQSLLQKKPEEIIPRIDAMVDGLRNFGLETTLKHFPYTPKDFNIHDHNEDTKIPEKKVDEEYLSTFREMAHKTSMIMTTHLYNSNVDPDNIVTFSKIWINKLRKDLDYKGLILSDALFMLRQHPESMKNIMNGWPTQNVPEFNSNDFVYAVKTIFSGHDMVFIDLEGREISELWKDLVRFSCKNDPVSNVFRERVNESFERITTYKNANSNLSKPNNNLSDATIKELLKLNRNQSLVCDNNLVTPFDDYKGDHLRPFNSLENCFASKGLWQGIFSQLEINKWSLDILKTIPIKDFIQAYNSGNFDEKTNFKKVLKEDDALKNIALEKARKMLLAGDYKDRLAGFEFISSLNPYKLDDENQALLRSFLEKGDDKVYDHYLKWRSSHEVPLPKDRVLLSKIIEHKLTENPFLMDIPQKIGNSQMLNKLFAEQSLVQLSTEEILKLNIHNNWKLVLLLKKNDTDRLKTWPPEIFKAFLSDYYTNSNGIREFRFTTFAEFEGPHGVEVVERELKAENIEQLLFKSTDILTSHANFLQSLEKDSINPFRTKALRYKITNDNENLKKLLLSKLMTGIDKNDPTGDISVTNFSNSKQEIEDLELFKSLSEADKKWVIQEVKIHYPQDTTFWSY
ncbi:MAG: hypothetical protein A2381_14630 [Bdellovibrionales bacterium RIFOXYB1_FULL_37_110]|nr:MAG: hypothetical protein A2417_08830 [Bdellovibrionales bacterium RIFOXYC1_FULL_37_79]OFZ60389.1 MAG: hypothetical protein A2381_14630 [Bdellovibrionales bacterium RIFOXYB1_FULL_37_110]OFZ64871.1 MAG: hypothetical protein A2577_15920 [Bdellovibrionales bacterium RIFOXYD1_FULL_36_51]